MSNRIIVEGEKYVVIENMGFIHDRGTYGKVIDFNGEDRVVLKIGGVWKFAKTLFRIRCTPITGQES